MTTTRTLLALVLLLACDADGGPPAAVQDNSAAARSEDPEAPRRAALWQVRPVETRAGQPRFTDPRLRDPLAAEVFGERLMDASVPAAERLALAEALPRCGGAWADVSVGRLAGEADAEVRAVLIAGLRRAEGEQALKAARLGLRDAESKVRRAAAELAGWVPEVGAALAQELQAALVDSSSEVRGAATRALGLTAGATVFATVSRGLADRDPQVRLEAVRALRRLDAKRAAALPELTALPRDPDERVQRAARG